jgi:hypothetical protein
MENENFELRRLMDRVGWVLALCIAVLIALSLLSSCTTTKYVEVERVRVDTAYITKWQKDSVWLHDSIHVKEKGDTVLIEKWHTKYVEKQVHDTTYVATHDTIPAPFPQTEYVEKELSWWQRTQMYAGDVMLVCLLALLGYGIIRLRR